MADFLTTKGVASEIENIIRKAEKEIVLVSPFLQLNKTFLERLGEASEKNIPITIVYGKDELKEKERDTLFKLDSLKLFFLEELHAKCYYNEKKLIITSMNMYAFSERNNREMGVLVETEKDIEIYREAVSETQSILRYAEQVFERKWNNFVSNGEGVGFNSKATGYCIRCESNIQYDPERPYCNDCFRMWVQFENPFFSENVCHNCGKQNSSSMDKPECWNCYNSW